MSDDISLSAVEYAYRYRLVGYTYDAAAYHPGCLPEKVDPTDEEVGAVASWLEEACTLTCDVCFEPLIDCDEA